MEVLSRDNQKTHIQFPIDALYVTKGVTHRGEQEHGPDGDPWSILFQLIDDCSGNTEVVRVKSHLEDMGTQVIKEERIAFHYMLAS